MFNLNMCNNLYYIKYPTIKTIYYYANLNLEFVVLPTCNGTVGTIWIRLNSSLTVAMETKPAKHISSNTLIRLCDRSKWIKARSLLKVNPCIRCMLLLSVYVITYNVRRSLCRVVVRDLVNIGL